MIFEFTFHCFAVKTRFLRHFFSIFKCKLEITEKADDFIAIGAFFGFDWNLFANHT
jgi:hypothetical protein